MKRLLFWLWLLIKRQLKSPVMMVFLIGMPVICFAVSKMPIMNEQGVPKVALCVSDDDGIVADAVEHLIKGQYSVEFYVVEDKSQLLSDVTGKHADHGFFFKDGLTEALTSREYEGCIELVQGVSADMLTTMTKEIVFAEIFRVYTLEVAVSYAQTAEVFDGIEEKAIQVIQANYKNYGSSNETFRIDFEEIDDSGRPMQMQEAKTVFPIRGVLAVLVFVAGLYGGVWWKTEKKKGVFVALPAHLSKVSRFIYVFVPTVLFAVSAEVSMALTGTADYPFELVKMLCYIVAIELFVAILTVVIPDEKLMVSVIPVLAIACLVLCPVFVSLTPVSPVFKYLSRLLLPFYYIV